MRRMAVITIMILALIAGCSSYSFKNGVYEDDFNKYRVKPPGENWKRMSVKDADLAFWDSELAGFILVNSTCDQYRDAPVAALANHLFIGIEKKHILLQEDVPVDGRQAVYTELEGMLDGAPVKVAAYTLVKNYCTYDLSYSAPPQNFEAGLPHFKKLVARFKVLKRKRKD